MTEWLTACTPGGATRLQILIIGLLYIPALLFLAETVRDIVGALIRGNRDEDV